MSVRVSDDFDRVQSEFNWSGGSCVQLDKLILKIRDKIVSERIKPKSSDKYIQELVDQKGRLEGVFGTYSCADKIETLRQNESAVLITKTSIEQEKSVLKPANTDQRIYIGAGALILLVGLFILVKK